MKRLMRRRGTWVAGLALAGAMWGTAGDAEAVRTRFFRTEGYEAFKRCKLEGAALTSDGRVLPGPAAEPLGDPAVRTVWDLAWADRGLVFVTGDQGKVFGLSDEEPEVITSLHNYELFALAAGRDGDIYAAGAPSGSIVRIDSAGETETVFNAPEGLIFDLITGEDGALYIATGERGLLYKRTRSGDTEMLTESGDVHLRRLAWSVDGDHLWAGTSGRGLLLSIDPNSGDSRVVFDAEEDEIVSIVPLPDGGLYFAANAVGQPAAGGNGETGAPEPTARVYRLDARGSVREVWTCPERGIHDMLYQSDGTLLVATGSAGALYEVSPDGMETVLWRADEEQVLALLRHDDRIFVGTGNPGRVYELGPDQNSEATVISEVLDARDQSTWGKLSWRTEGSGEDVQIETRTGSTSVPDGTWSGWSTPLTDPSGSQVQSPPGRFIQWRAQLLPEGDEAPVLRHVRVAHIGPNRPPRIAKISLSPDDANYRVDARASAVSQTLPGGVQVDYAMPMSRSNTLPPGGVPNWVREIRSIVWEAEDPDGDELAYTLEIRQLGDDDYRVIREDWREPAFSMETGLLPDGTYEIRVTASDGPTNPPGMGEMARRVTPPFQVDNQPPSVRDLRARRVDGPALQVTGTAIDEGSPLRSMQLSIDGGAFRTFLPLDGLLDSNEERFDVEVPLENDARGNWIVVQVGDAAGNEGSFRAWLEP